MYFLDWTTNVGDQTSEEEEGKENIGLEEDETRVKLPFRCLANLLFRSWCLVNIEFSIWYIKHLEEK